MMNDHEILRVRDLLMSEQAIVDSYREALVEGGRDAILGVICDSEGLRNMSARDAGRLANCLGREAQVDLEGGGAGRERQREDVAGWCQEMRGYGAWDGE